MSRYTMTVYNLLINNFNFGLNDYPIFDESYRQTLNDAIIEYYKFREIAFENPNQWRDRLRARMNIIMRNKYNKMYEAKLRDFNPFYNVDMTETYSHNVETNGQSNMSTTQNTTQNTVSTSKQNSNDDSLATTSSFPSEEMVEGDLTSNLFVDNASKNRNSSDVSSEDISNDNVNTDSNMKNDNSGLTKETYERKTLGSSAGLPFSTAITQYFDMLQESNIDQMIIDELSDLFITVY